MGALRPLPIILMWALAVAPAAAQEGPLRGLDAFVERGLREWGVPGLAVAVVKDDSLVYAKGCGVREIGADQRVGPSTVFGIMSMTKAFTATAMGMLVDRGRVSWDDRVTEHLPGFRVYDDWVTRNVTVRDLLSHHMGVERGDFLWYGTGYTRDEIVHHIRFLEPVAPFRGEYRYSNNMHIAAGRLISEGSLAATHTPQTPIRLPESARRLNPGIHFSAYAMGWQVQDYRGRKLVMHSGGIDGQRSRIALLPEEGLAVIVLTNRGNGNTLFDAVRNWVLDAYLGVQGPDWNAEFLAVMREEQSRAGTEQARVESERVQGTRRSLPLERYTGIYADSAYGQARVTLADGRLVVRIGPELRGVAEHWHFNTFRGVWDYAYDQPLLVSFELNARGEVARASFPGWWGRSPGSGTSSRWWGDRAELW